MIKGTVDVNSGGVTIKGRLQSSGGFTWVAQKLSARGCSLSDTPQYLLKELSQRGQLQLISTRHDFVLENAFGILIFGLKPCYSRCASDKSVLPGETLSLSTPNKQSIEHDCTDNIILSTHETYQNPCFYPSLHYTYWLLNWTLHCWQDHRPDLLVKPYASYHALTVGIQNSTCTLNNTKHGWVTPR